MKYRFKTKPFKHQRKALVRAIKQQHIGLLWEPGTGKTKTIVDWACAMHMVGRCNRVLIIAPLSVVGVWEDEFATHAPLLYRMFIMDKDTKRIPRPRGKLQICVVNYDLSWRRKEIIYNFNPEMVVADESHKCKRPSTRRSRFLRTLNKQPYRAILTGTPTPKSFLDLYGQWTFLNEKTFGTQIKEFKSKYILMGGYMGTSVAGYYNVDELKRKVRSDATILRKDQCLDLPPQRFQRIPVELEESAWQMYTRMEEEFLIELENGEIVDAKNAAVKLMRLQQITGGFVKTEGGTIHQVSEAKLLNTQDHVENLLEDSEKVVIFARFRPELAELERRMKKLGVPVYVVKGGVKRVERDAAWRTFQKLREPQIFLGQIASGGLGIQLQSAHECVHYSVSYVLDEYIQSSDRLHRQGQTEAVMYRQPVARGTADYDVYAALRAKQDIMKVIMGNPKRFAAAARRRRSKR